MSELADTLEDTRTASQLLSEARTAMGMSQEEVAQELYLIPSYIRHIDNDEIEDAGWYHYDNLPGRPSTNISIASKLLEAFIEEKNSEK